MFTLQKKENQCHSRSSNFIFLLIIEKKCIQSKAKTQKSNLKIDVADIMGFLHLGENP